MSALLVVQLVSLHSSLPSRMLRKAIAACDRPNTRSMDVNGGVDKKTRFFMYSISRSRGTLANQTPLIDLMSRRRRFRSACGTFSLASFGSVMGSKELDVFNYCWGGSFSDKDSRPGPFAGEWPEASGGSSAQSLAWRMSGYARLGRSLL